jgi:hypothetical protein
MRALKFEFKPSVTLLNLPPQPGHELRMLRRSQALLQYGQQRRQIT